MTRPFRSIAAAGAAILFATGCGGATTANAPASGAAPPTAAEFEALYRARLDSARMRFTEADVRFMSQMIHHHAQALEMAQLVPERTRNPQIRTLAARIINAQRDEITTMRRWLEDRGQQVPQVDGEMDGHAGTGHGPHAEMQMPGMLTQGELHELAQRSGAEFDELFLTSMIRHHRGAVTMVEELFATDGAGQDEEVFKFASDARVDQATEVARMEAMLVDMRAGAN